MKQTITLLLLLAASFAAQAQSKPVYGAAVWPQKFVTWTQTTVLTIRTVLPALEKAQDIEEFCPSYFQANQRSREICWLRIVGAIVKYESLFRPSTSFGGLGDEKMSVGLMSISPGDSEVAPSVELLKIAELNLQAGIEIMARLISEQGNLSGPEGARGAAGYWAPLRAPYNVGRFNLGQRDAIIKISSTYASY